MELRSVAHDHVDAVMRLTSIGPFEVSAWLSVPHDVMSRLAAHLEVGSLVTESESHFDAVLVLLGER